MISPRKSRVLEKLRAGRKAISFKINHNSMTLAEHVAICGYDCLWLCREHVPSDYAEISAQIMAAKAHDVDTVVRIPKGSYSDYICPLEADATGIMIPHLMSANEAKQIVQMTRFQPLGLRPVDGGNADGLYCKFKFKDYIKFANENRMVIVQIEDPEPLAELDEICSVPGIDMIFFGPGDFSHAIGRPAELNHPEVNRARKMVLETAHKHGKFAGTITAGNTMEELFDMGYDFLNIGSDVGAINSVCANQIDAYNEYMKDS